MRRLTELSDALSERERERRKKDPSEIKGKQNEEEEKRVNTAYVHAWAAQVQQNKVRCGSTGISPFSGKKKEEKRRDTKCVLVLNYLATLRLFAVPSISQILHA